MKATIITVMLGILLSLPALLSAAGETAVEAAPPVELFIADWCPNCRKAMDFLRSHGIEFVAYDVEKNETAARRKKQLDKRRLVPFAIINGKKVSGFSENEYLKALGINETPQKR